MITEGTKNWLKDKIGAHAFNDLLKAKNWSKKKKIDFVKWVSEAISYSSLQNYYEEINIYRTYYHLYLEVITNED